MRTASPGRVFELAGGHAALDLVNTLDWRFRQGDKDELLESYDDLLGFAEQSHLLTARQARELRRAVSASTGNRVLCEARELREALAEVFYAQLDGRNPGAAQIKVLERFLRDVRDRQKLLWSGTRFEWELAGVEDAPELPLWLLARAASGLVLSDHMEKLRACGDPECRWLFLDTSKNHTRRWCNMKVCGNRMKARRFKAQRKA
jgi:predicted RNA-binding Zn ribbon-like protein